jgi:hypothetical protein
MQFMAFINLTSSRGVEVRLNVAAISTYSADTDGGGSSVGRMGQQFALIVRETPEEIDRKILAALGQAVVFA